MSPRFTVSCDPSSNSTCKGPGFQGWHRRPALPWWPPCSPNPLALIKCEQPEEGVCGGHREIWVLADKRESKAAQDEQPSTLVA